jgi:hypothetical protein
MSKPSCDLHTSQRLVGSLPFRNVELPGAPPPSLNARALCRDLGIGIDRDDIRHYHGSHIVRKELLYLSPCALTRGASSRHRL